jgi:hypothetical protein
LLSRNGPNEDAELFSQLEADEPGCEAYFSTLGYHLRKSDGCYYFTTDDEPYANLETKLDRLVRLLRVLDFLSTHIESFGEGLTFSAATLGARCNNDPKAERFLQYARKGATNAERLTSMLHPWCGRVIFPSLMRIARSIVCSPPSITCWSSRIV